jgi:hypothetical protein
MSERVRAVALSHLQNTSRSSNEAPCLRFQYSTHEHPESGQLISFTLWARIASSAPPADALGAEAVGQVVA